MALPHLLQATYVNGTHDFELMTNMSSIAHCRISKAPEATNLVSCMNVCSAMTETAEVEKDIGSCRGLLYSPSAGLKCTIFTETHGDNRFAELAPEISDIMSNRSAKRPVQTTMTGFRPINGATHGMFVSLCAWPFALVSTMLLELIRDYILPFLKAPKLPSYTDHERNNWRMIFCCTIMSSYMLPDGPFDPRDKTYTTTVKAVWKAWVRVVGWEGLFLAYVIVHRFLTYVRVRGEGEKPDDVVIEEGAKSKAGRSESENVVDEDVVLVEKEDGGDNEVPEGV